MRITTTVRRAVVWDPDARRPARTWAAGTPSPCPCGGGMVWPLWKSTGRIRTEPNVLSPAVRPSHLSTSSEGGEISCPHSSLHTGVSAALFTAAQSWAQAQRPWQGTDIQTVVLPDRDRHLALSVNELQAMRRHGGSFRAHRCVREGHSRDNSCGSSRPS